MREKTAIGSKSACAPEMAAGIGGQAPGAQHHIVMSGIETEVLVSLDICSLFFTL